ncbi:MAG: metal ABC transporter permease [Verrucomicrobia bacterium]|nr:MAG: metal ABC transporter permease [Verrucomicrobiota bacterium]
MPEFLAEPFMQRALLAAIILGPLCGLLGVFVTARRMSFFSETIAHSALTGVALGFLAGFKEPTVPVLFVCCVLAVAMLWLKEHSSLLTDTIMAVLLSTSVAVGVVLLSLQRSRWADLDKYLFGDILSVSWNDVGIAAGIALTVGIVVFRYLNPLTLLATNEDLAHVSGVRVRPLNYAFVLLVTLTVALGVRLLGIVLVTSLVVIPAATARGFAHNLRQHLLFGILAGFVGASGGVALSYPLNLPTGPTITLTLATLFLVSLVFARARRRAAATSIRTQPGTVP